MFLKNENRTTSKLAAEVLEFVCCEPDVSTGCSIDKIEKQWFNENSENVMLAISKLVENGYVGLDSGFITLKTKVKSVH